MSARVVLVTLVCGFAVLVALSTAWIGRPSSDRSSALAARQEANADPFGANEPGRAAIEAPRRHESGVEPRRRTTLRDLVAPEPESTAKADAAVSTPPETDWERLRPTGEGPRIAERYEGGTPVYQGTQVLNADGVEEGPWDGWYENGNPMSSGTFRAGERVADRAPSGGPGDHLVEPLEQVRGVQRARGGFGVVLHAEARQRRVHHALDRLVVQVQVTELEVLRQ